MLGQGDAVLTLRALREADFTTRYLNWFKDERVTKYLDAKNITKEQAIEHRQKTLREGGFLYAICYAGLHIGNIKLTGKRDLVTVIGDSDYWGKGYATEAIQWMVNMAGPGTVTAGIRSGNIGSLNAYQKAGFVEVGRTQDVIYLAYK